MGSGLSCLSNTLVETFEEPRNASETYRSIPPSVLVPFGATPEKLDAAALSENLQLRPFPKLTEGLSHYIGITLTNYSSVKANDVLENACSGDNCLHLILRHYISCSFAADTSGMGSVTVDVGELDSFALRLHPQTFVGSKILTSLYFQCLFISEFYVPNRVLFLSAMPIRHLMLLSDLQVLRLLKEGYAGYYNFERDEQTNAVYCIRHLETVFYNRRPDTIHSLTSRNSDRFMILHSERSPRYLFFRLDPRPEAVNIDNGEQAMGIHSARKCSEETDMEEYFDVDSGIQGLQNGPCQIVITKLYLDAVEAGKVHEAISTILNKYTPKPVYVAYSGAARAQSCADAVFEMKEYTPDADMTVFICAYALYMNRSSLKTVLGATSF